jgi:hypothetical protein
MGELAEEVVALDEPGDARAFAHRHRHQIARGDETVVDLGAGRGRRHGLDRTDEAIDRDRVSGSPGTVGRAENGHRRTLARRCFRLVSVFG